MHRQVRTTPRKRPRQSRSQATVDSLLGATARVLVRDGFDGLTTNAVATAAGVSIGSLYQYFPNKEALVAALIEQHIEKMNSLVLAELAAVATLPIAQAARRVIELTIKMHCVDPKLHRVLTEQVPRVGRLAKLREADEICHRMVAGLLAARKDELAIHDADLSAFLLVSTIEAVVHRAAMLYPDRLDDPRLIDETTLLVTRYLGVAVH
ncbi:MAG: TetR family transcriptional regulator [Deltaproteobacteria bacterium]|nr:TetR family transcriptional regulator [Deltaproteobacteria bacterium]